MGEARQLEPGTIDPVLFSLPQLLFNHKCNGGIGSSWLLSCAAACLQQHWLRARNLILTSWPGSDAHPDERQLFHRAMESVTSRAMQPLIQAFPWRQHSSIIDLGGAQSNPSLGCRHRYGQEDAPSSTLITPNFGKCPMESPSFARVFLNSMDN